MQDTIFLILKIVHVLVATAWVGGAFFAVAVLPSLLAQSTPLTGREFGGRLRPATLRYHHITGGLTLLTGLLLVSYHPGWNGLLQGSLGGKLIVFALVATLFALYLLGTAVRSTTRALAKVLANTPPDIEPPANLRFLQKRLTVAYGLLFVILAGTLVAMVAANYYGS